MDVGYYINIFPVEFQENTIEVVTVNREKFSDLRPLREEIRSAEKEVFVYADGDKVYGYGRESAWLSSKEFSSAKINLNDTPRLTGRMILEGFVNKLKEKGYSPVEGKGRCRIFNWTQPQQTSDGNVNVFKGFDLRSIFLKDQENNEFIFGIVIDVTYAFRDNRGNPLNFRYIVTQYGSQTLRNVRQIQGDLIPTGINTEISRQRFIEEILPFVKNFPNFQLPCDIEAMLKAEPMRLILGGKNENLL